MPYNQHYTDDCITNLLEQRIEKQPLEEERDKDYVPRKTIQNRRKENRCLQCGYYGHRIEYCWYDKFQHEPEALDIETTIWRPSANGKMGRVITVSKLSEKDKRPLRPKRGTGS